MTTSVQQHVDPPVVGGKHVEGILAGRRLDHPQARLAQGPCNEPADRVLIVDEKHHRSAVAPLKRRRRRRLQR
jgi:hypothetical protein